MKRNSTKRQDRVKPAKPYEDYPLFPHANGYWAKKIRGKLHYFGKWEAPDAALDKYLKEKDYLHAGKVPSAFEDGLTIRDLCNLFLTSKRHLLDTSEITPRTFYDYRRVCERIIDVFNKSRMVEDLSPSDFEKLRNQIAKTYGAVALGNEIQRIRTIFKYAFEDGHIDKPIRFGQAFKKPSRRVVRKKRQENGKRMFEADELRTIIESASQPLKSIILLGINCGFGQSDVSSLPKSSLDLESGWLEFPRPKTSVERRIPLWKETVTALRESLQARPNAKSRDDSKLAFITKYGHRWVKQNQTGTPDDAIGKEFTKLLNALKLKRKGVSFYALRHTFETIGGESKDQVAVNSIMGHVDDSMSAVYRERISGERLQAVVDHVHAWLFDRNK